MQSPKPPCIVGTSPLERRDDLVRWLNGQDPGCETLADHPRATLSLWATAVILEARRDERLVGAVMARELATGFVEITLPRLITSEEPITGERLLCELHDRELVQAAGLLMVHAAEGGGDYSAWLQAAGYRRSDDLLIMGQSTCSLPGAEPTGLPTGLLTDASDVRLHHQLAKVLDATYVQTRDYPELNGHLPAAAALAIYRTSSDMSPRQWFLIQDAEQIVGCLLMVYREEMKTSEISYMGVVPAARRQGWGKRVLSTALETAKSSGSIQVVLGVSAGNDPAIGLYARAGFDLIERRAFLWRPGGV